MTLIYSKFSANRSRFATFAKLHDNLQIICKYWPISIGLLISTNFQNCAENAWQIWSKSMHFRSILLFLLNCIPEAPLWVGWVDWRGLDELLWWRPSSSSSQCNALHRLASERISHLLLTSMAFVRLIALLSINQLPSLVQSAVFQGGEQILNKWNFLGWCGWDQICNQQFANMRAVKSPAGPIERDENSGQPVLFLGHGGENRCHIGRARNTLCKVLNMPYKSHMSKKGLQEKLCDQNVSTNPFQCQNHFLGS